MAIAKLILIYILVVIIMVISMNDIHAWVGGQLLIKEPVENSIISGNITFNVTITGSYTVHKLSIFGKAVDTSSSEFKLINESTGCGFWNDQKMCSINVDTTKLEDSNLWQFYAIAENASNPSDNVKSVTVTNVVVNNPIPAIQPIPYITPNFKEIIRTEDVSFGVMVNSKTVTNCLITFTSHTNPGKRVYVTEYEEGEYCNLTINVPANSYTFTFAATDGLDISPATLPQTFFVDTSRSNQQKEQAKEQPEINNSGNFLTENWVWIATVIVLFLIFRGGKRRRK